MSIIGSLCLADGIIMAADSRLTIYTEYTDGTKTKEFNDNSIKLYQIKNRNIGIAWCGDYEVDNLTIPEFIEHFNEQISMEDSTSDIANKLNECCIGRYRESIRWQIAGYHKGEQYLYQVVNDTITRKNINPETGTPSPCVVWDGFRKMTRIILDNDIPVKVGDRFIKSSDIPSMSIKDGIYLLKGILMASCHEYEGCGGDVDLLIIRPEGLEWESRKEVEKKSLV